MEIGGSALFMVGRAHMDGLLDLYKECNDKVLVFAIDLLGRDKKYHSFPIEENVMTFRHLNVHELNESLLETATRETTLTHVYDSRNDACTVEEPSGCSVEIGMVLPCLKLLSDPRINGEF